ncbi:MULTISPECIES: Asp-tRNA(Asn)/Glu-tRNA(Gln) amidotransferase subunit GatC [Oceanospirillaceae]|jgi:aspartyl-tRNA(Asn)/glutamyl-tRNA(Gln) amidotransferase subunit C|uniref:Aspartyl/glutamyl-tRNA(Asn/Gln) amidotransferase subunit C n=1 Tax=Thalassolituus hydrocarboniclasticus TaxID=2742796 RepID=A0ABY6A5X1_9GAMM|nr:MULTISPECIES: Asp-tRNA(Asn)/Glu-tRNA(Gln) amidotransferase subunit GatC [Thalassolituus]MAY14265.1 Asp-tRNA(Asn)/Glu-tRNA(Gln) amidotransferase GatCAB subunit C [Oceanospirillaceae bacterium]MCA6060012.1 Asp-tRNA(Asn)/Glu-tRNA(Gln) amidotransferase subunit GatC [Thalassolituus sp. ST750PaO-4]MCB2388346.1 Asp-tRNA(Asn)/Glu-tRNA(Gln) amidotransferase subunit GatC [Thalassolituus alkanivorans]MCB2423936.1 Asp-tRNA(Asn)/Glu-tRNA(Gln) amidotransferase subunit GatC [Thalassolituus alkanivorans]TV
MALDQQQVRDIADLSRLQIDEAQIAEYQKNLSNILDLVDQLSAVDTSSVEPMAHPLDAVQRLRADVVTEENNRDHFQQIAPQTENGYYLVPRVVE